jgi:hypothetical protein
LLRDLLCRTLIGREPLDVEEGRVLPSGWTTPSIVMVFTRTAGLDGEASAKTSWEIATAAKAIERAKKRL